MVVTVKTFDNTNRVIRKHKAKKDGLHNAQNKKDKRTKGQTIIYKTLNMLINICTKYLHDTVIYFSQRTVNCFNFFSF